MATQLSQEVVENDLQTDPENHLHQPQLNTPIITLSPPTVMNSLPTSLYSHTLCSGTSLPPRPLILDILTGAQVVARHASPTPVVQVWHVIVSDCFSWGRRAARQSTSLML